MSDQDTAAIEQKKTESTENGEDTPNNWGAFGAATINNIIITLVFGFIGANFIFFTTSTQLDKFFPVNKIPDYFPQFAEGKRGGQKGNNYTCFKKDSKGFNLDGLKSLGIGEPGGWPYSMRQKETFDQGIFQSFKNWFADSIADTFIMSRKVLRKWLSFFTPDKKFLSNQTFQMFLVAPLSLFFGKFAAMATGFFGYIYNSFADSWIWALIGLFFGYTLFFAFMVMVVHLFKFLGTFLLLPIFANFGLLGEIFKCNSNALAMLFGALMVSSASTTLNSTISTAMMVVYVLLLIKTIFF